MSLNEDHTTHPTIDNHGLDFVFYDVTDITASVSFYRDTLGLALEVLHDGEKDGTSGYAEFALPPTTLGLAEVDPQEPSAPGGGGAGIALAVDDVDTATEALRNEGVTVLMDPLDTGDCHMAIIGDPDENQILIHSRHDGTHGRIDPFP